VSETKDIETKGAEEARKTLPTLLERAERGQATIITRHGRRVAAIVPIGQYDAYVNSLQRSEQRSLLPLRGSGVGLWGEDSTRTIRELRDEWTR
jgi:prevent-host-death family protein